MKKRIILAKILAISVVGWALSGCSIIGAVAGIALATVAHSHGIIL